MKISKMIEDLNSLKEKLGDVEVIVNIDGFGGHASYTTHKIDETKVYKYHYEEFDIPEEEFNIDFPNADYTGKAIAVQIYTDKKISAT